MFLKAKLTPMAAIRLGAMIAALLVLATFLAGWHPAFDTLGHFRFHLGVVSGVLGFVAVLGPGSLSASGVIALAMAAIALTQTLAAFAPIGPPPAFAADDRGERLSVLQLNVRYNATPDRAVAVIEAAEPDVVLLQEVTFRWQDALSAWREHYPHQALCDRGDRVGGVAILSNRPFEANGGFCEADDRLIVRTVRLGERRLAVGSIHMPWPWPFDQQAAIDRLSGPLASLDGPRLIAGDFNAAPWSAAVGAIAEASDTAAVPGVGATWLYRRLPAALTEWVGLPIDIALASEEVHVVSARPVARTGSDHLPVLLEVALGR